MWTLSMVSAIISLLSGVTGLIAFALELRRSDGKLGKMTRAQSVALTVTLILTAVVAAVVWNAERKRDKPEPLHVHGTDTGTSATATTQSAVTDTVASSTITTDTIATGTMATDSVASDTSTTTRREPDPPKPQHSIRISSASGVPQGDVVGALNGAIALARRQRSVITGRISRDCRPDHVFASVTVCDETLDLNIRDVFTGARNDATLTGQGVGSTSGDATRDARKKLIAEIREHFSGEDQP